MNKQQAIIRLKNLGFKFDFVSISFGTMDAEPIDMRPDHFTPIHRDVYFAPCCGGWYVTSHILGTMRRRYRRRNSEKTDVANIFGGGKTLQEAIEVFERNFKSKTYNVQGRIAS